MNEQSECLNCANGEVDVTVEAHKMYLDQADSLKGMSDDNQKAYLVKWLNDMLPYLCLPSEASDEQLRTCLIDGSALCNILNKLKPSSIEVGCTSESHIVNVERFLAAVRQMGFPGFDLSNLEQGSMKPVLQCLWTLRAHFLVSSEGESIQYHPRKRWNLAEVEFPEDRQCATLYRVPSPGCIDNLGEKFETFQLKQDDASDANISELMKSDNLDIVSTQSLFSIVNKILDESIERKNGGVPHPVACLLRKVVRVIEQRVAAQAVHFRKQQNKFKAREEKYQSRIGVLETLMTGTAEETGVVMNQLQRIKIEKAEIEEKRKLDQKDLSRLMEEKEKRDTEVLALNQELNMTKKTYENQCTKFEKQSKEIRAELEKKLAELECLLTDSRKTVKELKAFSESKIQRWRLKELTYQGFINSQYGALQELRVASDSIKEEVFKSQKGYSEEFKHLVGKLKGVTDAAQNYHTVLAENRKLYNEVQDLKGNIRVYCRIRPFLPGQNTKQTTIQYIGENGDLVTVNPLKPGKDSHRLFKFNKVFGPAATQEDVFFDTQPLIRSVLDGFNVCIFAYGQTGSGKTYTMSGPSISLKDGWGVNYRALNDLFHLSQSRSCIQYEVGVQMVEIYNEQVRDLLLNDGSQKRLGIWSTTQPNGLAVPEASMRPVKSTTDVLELMKIGLMNRAVGATALNERSSRSHSILTVHVRGTDLETSAVLRGNLHLVDLAGSERVDRSEATGDRLKEAQHINKSLSALGDVIFALAHKSGHVPYRNSKLTQVLHSSLGGQAKTLMFVQLNPDAESYSETISTLKFAERVSGVELGAARSNKEGRSLRELMDQVASLKEIIAKKDEEIERVRLLKVNSNGDKRGITSLRYGSSSPRRHSTGTPRQSQRLPEGKRPEPLERSASELGNCSIYSDKQSEAGSHQSAGDYSNHKEPSPQSKDVRGDVSQNFIEDVELLGFGDGDSDERLSDISDSVLSMGTETDGSISSMVELALFPEGTKPPEITEKSNVPCKLSMPPPQKPPQTKTPRLSSNQSSSKLLSSVKKTTLGCSSSSTTKSSLKRWQ